MLNAPNWSAIRPLVSSRAVKVGSTRRLVRPADRHNLGNSGRNNLYGPGEAAVSSSLFRTIHLNEKGSPGSSTFLTRRISAIPGAPLAPPATALSHTPEMRVSFNLF